MLLDNSPPTWLNITFKTSYIILLTSVLLSFLQIALSYVCKRWPKSEGHIRLADDFGIPTRKALFNKLLLEYIDGNLASDGEPVDLPGFWRSVRFSKAVVLLLSLGNFGFHVYLAQNSIVHTHLNAWLTVRLVAESLAASYIALIAGCYVCTRTVTRHTSLTQHICSLAAVSFVHRYLVSLGQYLDVHSMAFIHWTQYSALGLVFALMIVSSRIPLGPLLHQDLVNLYNKAVDTKLAESGYDGTVKEANVNREVSASIWSFLLATYVFPMISKTSSMEQVDITDLPAPQAWLRTQNVIRHSYDLSTGSGISSRFGPTMGLLWAVWSPEWRVLLKIVTYMMVLCPMWYLPHFCYSKVLYVLDNVESNRAAVSWAILMVLSKMANTIVVIQQFNLSQIYMTPRLVTFSSYLLYNKVLSRNAYALPPRVEKGKDKKVYSKADILNLISPDTSALAQIGFVFVRFFRMALELFLGGMYVWALLGPSGFYGLATLAVTLPPAYVVTKLQYKLFEKRLAISDEKLSLMQEAIQAISMIKMMAAERFWFKRVKEVREREFSKLIQARLLGTLSGLLYSAAPTVVVVVAFAHYTLVAKKTLTAPLAFTSIAVFDELRPALMELPTLLARFLQEILSAKRIGTFLSALDVEYLDDLATDGEPVPAADKIFVRGTVTWDIPDTSNEDTSASANPIFQLQDLDLEFPRGQMSLIAGKFGCGKTLLLLALLGEGRLVDGKISYLLSHILDPSDTSIPDWTMRKDGVAYVPQVPWLQSQSIRENILFGLPMDFERYRAVIFAVGLLPDLDLLEDADLTEIGERGKILSGGQKARVSLARAVYSRASVLLLDDVISAVDAQTSKHIIQHCFNSELTRDRTIIIASHAVELLAPLASHAVFLEDGRSVWSGIGAELLESTHMAHLKTELTNAPTAGVDDAAEKIALDAGDKSAFEIKEAVPKTPRQLIIDENRQKGSVSVQHWMELKRFNGNNLFWTTTLVILFASVFMPIAQRRALVGWTSNDNVSMDLKTATSWLSFASTLIDSAFSLFRFWGGVNAARKMLESMLRARMSFFTKTRAGSIIQRFGKDLNDTIDCSEMFGEIAEVLLHIVVNIVTVTITGGWAFGVVCVILIAGVWAPAKWYRSSVRQLRRLEMIIPGPINAIYGETVAGTAVIRAFGLQSVFVTKLLRELNMRINTSASRTYTSRWLYINMQLMNVVITSTALLLILTQPGFTGASAGFMLLFASGISWNINWLLLNLRDFDLKGVSLERTTEYRLLPREDGEVLNADDPRYSSVPDTSTPDWPSNGAIKVHELRVRYGSDLPDILHDVSFEIQGGQRVGIVGATGGGKSTLAKAFFSFVDITHGHIDIDGRDIGQVPLGEVRSKLGIIAQDPILLSGSLRLNLDIESKYTDEELYDALHQVQLLKRSTSTAPSSASSESEQTVVEQEGEGQKNIFANLDYEIKSGGENLSAGQKQLVVLARALLKRHKVLILDEATASIDTATDAEISRVVHEEFKGATVMIIAHRLRTIMPCSKILVMDKGNLVQQGSPLELIRIDGGIFQTLCMAAGMEEYRHLVSLAEASAKQNAGLSN